MCEYGFAEGADFDPLKNERVQEEGNREVVRTVIDHQLTSEMAKELCMIHATSGAGRRAGIPLSCATRPATTFHGRGHNPLPRNT